MAFYEEIRGELEARGRKVDRELSDAGVEARVNRLARASPIYKKLLWKQPELLLWLERPENREERFRYTAFRNVWQEEFEKKFSGQEAWLEALQAFRRRMSLRIAYREINELSPVAESLKELSLLAEFCLQAVCNRTYKSWERRLGRPWIEGENRLARYCVLGLGKLGGEELNFCSDIDLIFFYEGRGQCRKQERTTQVSNEEFFSRFVKDVVGLLQKRTHSGFLYNVDLRLRPEGQSGHIVRTLNSMQNYYYAAGQTWERLALIKARVVAGNKDIGEEFLEAVQNFRYPHFPPPSLLEEVAGTKVRLEKEVTLEQNLQYDIKNGYGGIREIEFYVQTLQLLNAGQNPFLQTPGTFEALKKLARYRLLSESDADYLEQAYRFLRLVENRLQMKEEHQTHTLPTDKEELKDLACSLGFQSELSFQEKLQATRQKIRMLYSSLLKESHLEEEIQEWTLFLTGKPPSQKIAKKLKDWLGTEAPHSQETFSNFIRGGPLNLLTREQVKLFLEISSHFNHLFPELACPQETLARISRFAESYKARKQFLRMCSNNPGFLQTLSLLFDRSTFIHKLLCQHPEIMEEVLLGYSLLQKNVRTVKKEIAHLPQGTDFERWLWLYVKAEQVRLAAAELVGNISIEELEKSLTTLADAVIEAILERVDPEEQLTLVALGKYGGQEMTFGSDLAMWLRLKR